MPAHALLPAVNRLLQQVEETSGLPVAVAQQSDLSTLATVRPATPERQAYLIAYREPMRPAATTWPLRQPCCCASFRCRPSSG